GPGQLPQPARRAAHAVRRAAGPRGGRTRRAGEPGRAVPRARRRLDGMTAAADRADLQRDRILQAAQRCFVEHGFHAASMASIAGTAGVSAGLIYRYFASKNEIIVAIVERQLALLRQE